MIRTYVGIDPGVHGAIAVCHIGNTVSSAYVWDMPIVVKKTSTGINKSFYDILKLIEILKGSAAKHDRFVIEDVMAMPHDGGTQAFSLGKGMGILEGVTTCLGYSPTFVRPAVWKKAMSLTASKDESLEYARTLFPALSDSYLARKKDHNRAEALLLCHYGYLLDCPKVPEPQAPKLRRIK